MDLLAEDVGIARGARAGAHRETDSAGRNPVVSWADGPRRGSPASVFERMASVRTSGPCRGAHLIKQLIGVPYHSGTCLGPLWAIDWTLQQPAKRAGERSPHFTRGAVWAGEFKTTALQGVGWVLEPLSYAPVHPNEGDRSPARQRTLPGHPGTDAALDVGERGAERQEEDHDRLEHPLREHTRPA